MTPASLAPALLIAMPQLQDPNFHHTVILLVEHNEEGSFGLVLNRSTDVIASEVCASLDIPWRGDPGFLIHCGGPVQPDSGWVLSGAPEPGTDRELSQVMEGVHFTSSIEALRSAAIDQPKDLRLFLGYTGWGPGQLEAELTQGAWLTAPATKQSLFEIEDRHLWKAVLRDLGVDPATLVMVPGVH
jgi:putative transcriptional regulator